MAKASLFLLSLLGGASASHSLHPFQRRTSFVPKRKADTLVQKTVALRGGDLSAPEPKTLAKCFSLLTASDALVGTFAPVASAKLLGWDIEDKSLDSFFVSVMGAKAMSLTVSNYLAVSGATSLEEAIAYGNIMRLIFLGRMLAVNRLNELGFDMVPFLFIGLSVLGSTYSLFSGEWKPLVSASLVSVLVGVFGSMLYLCPVDHVKELLGVDLDAAGKVTQNLCKFSGAYTMLSAFNTGLLAHKVDPVKAAGYTSLATIALFGPLASSIQVESILGISKSLFMFLVLCLLGGLAAGTLL